MVGKDDKLYYGVCQGLQNPGFLFRVNLNTFEKEMVGTLWANDRPVNYLAHAVRDEKGNFYWGELAVPTRMGIYSPPYGEGEKQKKIKILKRWG